MRMPGLNGRRALDNSFSLDLWWDNPFLWTQRDWSMHVSIKRGCLRAKISSKFGYSRWNNDYLLFSLHLLLFFGHRPSEYPYPIIIKLAYQLLFYNIHRHSMIFRFDFRCKPWSHDSSVHLKASHKMPLNFIMYIFVLRGYCLDLSQDGLVLNYMLCIILNVINDDLVRLLLLMDCIFHPIVGNITVFGTILYCSWPLVWIRSSNYNFLELCTKIIWLMCVIWLKIRTYLICLSCNFMLIYLILLLKRCLFTRKRSII